MFIPRPETELLVTQILSFLDEKIFNLKSILEFGTGTGAISLAINKEFKNKHKIIAIDNDKISINYAKNNARLLKVKNIKFHIRNWFKLIFFNKKFDYIISNPPYVDPNDFFFQYKGNHFESYTTTLSFANGLKDLFHIIYCANRLYLKHGGWLILEHGWHQTNYIKKFLELNNFYKIETKKDYSLNNRITFAKKK